MDHDTVKLYDTSKCAKKISATKFHYNMSLHCVTYFSIV